MIDIYVARDANSEADTNNIREKKKRLVVSQGNCFSNICAASQQAKKISSRNAGRQKSW